MEKYDKIIDDIESMLISHCDSASSNQYSIVDGFNVAADTIFKKYQNKLSLNQIVYFIRHVVSKYMRNPASTIFDYVCVIGINAKFITSNIPFISKDDYINFCMSNEYYSFDNKYDTVSQHAMAIMSYFLNNIKNGHIGNSLPDNVDKKNVLFLRLDNVFSSMQKLYGLVRDSSDFINLRFDNLEQVKDEYKEGYFVQNENIHILREIDVHWGIDTIFEFARKAIVGDYISFTDENDLTILCDIIGLNLAKDLDPNDTGIHLIDVIGIINTFIMKYVEVVKDMYSFEAQYLPETYPLDCSAMALTYDIIVSILDSMLIPLENVISNIEKYTDDGSFYESREVLYDIYSCIYDNVLFYNANRRYLDGIS